MELEFTINTDFLDALQPPSNFPPSQDDLTNQVEQKFLQQCQKFITNERLLYKCSKSIQNRLSATLNNSQQLKDSLSAHHDHYLKVAEQLVKYRKQRQELRQREVVLRMLCDLIKMEDIRKDLLISGDSSSLKQNKKQALLNEDDYLSKLSRLNQIVDSSEQLQDFTEEFPLLKDILSQLKSIFQQALKVLLTDLMTPTMVELSLNKYHSLFFKEKAEKGIFWQAMVRNRIQHMKINLNPMINNLSYASNIPELYQSILQLWATLLSQQVTLLSNCRQLQIIREANDQLLQQMIPKMQKNIFRIKDLVQVVRIRKAFSEFNKAMQAIEQLSYKDDTLLKGVVSKSQAVIESMMTQQAQQLQSSKYNIYTMASYLPIRQHLDRIVLCYQNSVENEQIDWEGGFESLCSSRDPKNYPNNKSLLIFNLNIWYLYIKLLPAGKHAKEGQQILQWCQNTFANINLIETRKKFFDSFQKVLEIGGNITAFKNTLYAEVQLLGHEELRRTVSETIRVGYMEGYRATLKKIEKEPMSNEEVKVYCQSKKINLNKFGKFSQSVCIYSPEELFQLLQYK